MRGDVISRLPVEIGSGAIHRLAPAVALLALATAGACADRGPGAPVSLCLLARLPQANTTSPPRAEVGLRAIELAGEERPAIFAHAPSTITYSGLRLPAQPLLVAGLGIAESARRAQGDGVDFAVRVTPAGGAEVEAWRRTMDPAHDPADSGWVEVEVSLEPWAGLVVDLTLATEPRKSRLVDFSVWSSPRLVGRGREPIAESGPIRRLSPVHRFAGESERLAVPTGGTLELAGEINRRTAEPVATGPALFRVLVDGDPQLEHRLPTTPLRNAFGKSVPLPAYEGRRVDVRFEIVLDDETRLLVDAAWLQRDLVAATEVDRRPAADGPSLLMIVVDTLRRDRLSLYGYERQTSPNLDSLAAGAAVFDLAISSSSWTMPATASLLTGLYPTEHGVNDGQSLDWRLETLAELLQERGFTTAAVIANPVVGKAEGFDQGFEHFVHLPWARAGTVSSAVESLLDDVAGQRSFVYVHYIDPHDPYAAPEPWGSTWTGAASNTITEKPVFEKLVKGVNFGVSAPAVDPADLAFLRDRYDGEIRYLDHELASLLGRLAERGFLDEAILVITSDHGEGFLDHGRLKHGLDLYDESIRVPLIVRAPGRLAPGRYDALVETRLLPRLCQELLAARVGAPVDAVALLSPPGQLAFSHTLHALAPNRSRTELVAVRGEDFKYLRYPDDGRAELYDVEQDPAESRDVLSQDPEDASRQDAILRRWLAQTRGRSIAAGDQDPEILAKLRALGYIE